MSFIVFTRDPFFVRIFIHVALKQKRIGFIYIYIYIYISMIEEMSEKEALTCN